MNLVSLIRFNELRFAHDPVAMPKLWRWCRAGKLPARKIGGEWFIDLDAFDRESIPQKAYSTDIPSRVVSLLMASSDDTVSSGGAS